MWGPRGGKGGTLSQLWIEERASIENGGAAEFSRMTMSTPDGFGTLREVAAEQARQNAQDKTE